MTRHHLDMIICHKAKGQFHKNEKNKIKIVVLSFASNDAAWFTTNGLFTSTTDFKGLLSLANKSICIEDDKNVVQYCVLHNIEIFGNCNLNWLKCTTQHTLGKLEYS